MDGAGLSLRRGGRHGDLQVAVTGAGHCRQAEPPVEGLSAVVDDEHVEDEVLVLVPGLVDGGVDEAGAEAAALMVREDVDAGEVDLVRAAVGVEHADVCAVGRDDLPAARLEGADVETALDLVVPAPDRRDVVAHGGLVQLEAELGVGSGSRPQCDDGHGPSAPWVIARAGCVGFPTILPGASPGMADLAAGPGPDSGHCPPPG